MDVTLALKLGIPTQPLSIPIYVRALDGRSMGQVTHHSNPINLRVSGNHSDPIRFLLVKSPQVPVVLGFSWLRQHNPFIDWSTGAIVGWSPFCHAHCLKSALPAREVFLGAWKLLSTISAEYQDLREGFSKARATSLPQHQPVSKNVKTDTLAHCYCPATTPP
jgi:hypothetical protein